MDFNKAPFLGLGLTFASHPETGEVGQATFMCATDDICRWSWAGAYLTIPQQDPQTDQLCMTVLSGSTQFTVDDILEDSPASFSQIQIGDRLRMVSSACDESASAAQSEHAHRLRRRRKKVEKVCRIPLSSAIWHICPSSSGRAWNCFCILACQNKDEGARFTWTCVALLPTVTYNRFPGMPAEVWVCATHNTS